MQPFTPISRHYIAESASSHEFDENYEDILRDLPEGSMNPWPDINLPPDICTYPVDNLSLPQMADNLSLDPSLWEQNLGVVDSFDLSVLSATLGRSLVTDVHTPGV